MKSVKLFRLLQQHAAQINALAMAVYKEKKEASEALKEAKDEIARVSKELKDK